MVRAVAALDRRFQEDGLRDGPTGAHAESLTESEYRARRQELMERVLHPPTGEDQDPAMEQRE